MIKQTGLFAMLFALLVATLVLSGCPAPTEGETEATTAVPPQSAAAPSNEVTLASVTYRVEGMTCDHCVKGITEAVSSVPGVKACKVDLESATAKVEYDPTQANDELLIKQINALGYTASVQHDMKANLEALAGETGCACGAEEGSGECSGECGDPLQSGEGSCGSCEEGATVSVPTDIPDGCERTVIYVEGLGCPNKAAKLASSINALAGVAGAYVDCAAGTVTVDYQKESADPTAFKKEITSFGLKVLDGPPSNSTEQEKHPVAQSV